MAEIAYSYSESDNPLLREKVKFEKVDDKVDEHLNPRERRLAEIRNKLKQSRNENRKAVIEEEQSKNQSASEAKRRFVLHSHIFDPPPRRVPVYLCH